MLLYLNKSVKISFFFRSPAGKTGKAGRTHQIGNKSLDKKDAVFNDATNTENYPSRPSAATQKNSHGLSLINTDKAKTLLYACNVHYEIFSRMRTKKSCKKPRG